MKMKFVAGSMMDWKGTEFEFNKFMQFIMESIQEDMDIQISDADMRKLFCEAMTRNTVIGEIKNTIQFILDNDVAIDE